MQTTPTQQDGNPLLVHWLLMPVTLSACALLCVVALAMRIGGAFWLTELFLLLAGLTCAGLLAVTGSHNHQIVQWIRYVLVALATVAIMAWAPSWVAGLAFAFPVLSSVFVPLYLRQFGRSITVVLDQSSGTQLETMLLVEPVTQPLEQPTEHQPQSDPAAQIETTGEPDESEDDPWSTLREQFVTDPSLARNIATWQDDEGNWSLVANIRCHFSTPSETCIVHLPIWPIADETPEVFARVAGGPAAGIKTTDAHPHGLRLEVKLEDSSQETPIEDVLLEVVATITAQSREAAA